MVFEYPGKLERVVDGDTFYIHLDVGFGLEKRSTHIRLYDIDTHEISGVKKESEEYKKGMDQKRFVQSWFATAFEMYDGEYPLIVKTYEQDSFGRWLGSVERKYDVQTLDDALIKEYGEDIIYNG